MNHSPSTPDRPKLAICIFLESDQWTQAILPILEDERYTLTIVKSNDAFYTAIEREKHSLDCLVLQSGPTLPNLANWLHGQATLLPAVLVTSDQHRSALPSPDVEAAVPMALDRPFRDETAAAPADFAFTYHTAEVWLPLDALETIGSAIEQAISRFLHLSPACWLTGPSATVDVTVDLTAQNFLMLQQHRLSEKLKERLGYLGVYYKRDPRNFFRHLSPPEQEELLDKLREDYRAIVLQYFEDDSSLNQQIDEFVNTAFFTDIAVAQVVEIHMDLMDEFAKQLKLEGRSEDILLDYRLTLIDTIAHLCEMYRRSVPRES